MKKENEVDNIGAYIATIRHCYKSLTKKELLVAIADILQQRDIFADMLLNDIEHSDEFLEEVGIGCGLNIELRTKKRRSAE